MGMNIHLLTILGFTRVPFDFDSLILFCKAYQTHMFCKDRLAPATIPSQTDVCLIDS